MPKFLEAASQSKAELKEEARHRKRERVAVRLAELGGLPDDAYVSVAVYAAAMGRGESSTWRDIKNGALPTIKVGGSRRILVAHIRRALSAGGAANA